MRTLTKSAAAWTCYNGPVKALTETDAPPPEAAVVSVVLALYRSEATLGRCLEALNRQSYRDFEVIAVDSAPDGACAPIVAAFANRLRVRYIHSPVRLLPQEARNAGAQVATGRVLVFSDPDCYAAADWLERLLAAHEATAHPIVGALACHGDRALDRAVHLTKFSKWLPAGAARPVDMAPTANFLCARALFMRHGGFSGDGMLGDTSFSWQLRATGSTLWFEPKAVVHHHHLDTLRTLVRERFRRGKLFARVRMDWLAEAPGRQRWKSAFFLATSVLPIRLASNLWHVGRHTARARSLRRWWDFFSGLPVVALGMQATLLGESAIYARELLAERAWPSRVAASGVDEGEAGAEEGAAASRSAPRGSVSS